VGASRDFDRGYLSIHYQIFLLLFHSIRHVTQTNCCLEARIMAVPFFFLSMLVIYTPPFCLWSCLPRSAYGISWSHPAFDLILNICGVVGLYQVYTHLTSRLRCPSKSAQSVTTFFGQYQNILKRRRSGSIARSSQKPVAC